MPSPRPKPPAQPKAELMHEIVDLCASKWPTQPDVALLHILNYFTGVDLEAIRNELRKSDAR